MLDADLRASVLALNAPGQGFSRFVTVAGDKAIKCVTVSHTTVAVICSSWKRDDQPPSRFVSWFDLAAVSLALAPSEVDVRKLVPPPCRPSPPSLNLLCVAAAGILLHS